MFEPEAGRWYVVVNCEKCKTTIFLFPDLTEVKAPLTPTYIVTCPRCAHKGGYHARHYLHSEHDNKLAVSEARP